MSWNTIRTQISTLLDNSGEFQEVSSVPKLKFKGYPAAYIVPSDSVSDYEDSSHNKRTYAFNVRLFYETKQTGVGDALDKLEGIVDTVLDTLDQEDLKGAASRTIGIDLPAGYTYINIYAHPSVWGEIPDENLLFAEIKVSVRVSRDVT